MKRIIAKLLAAIGKALRLLAQFLAILLLGLLVALLYALPWLLRLACILVWLMGAYLALQAVHDIYQPISPTGPVLALQFAVIFGMVAWAGSLLRVAPKLIWGGLALGGLLPAWVAWKAIPWLLENWQHTGLFFRVLPPALFSLLLIYITLRMRFLRSNSQLSPSRAAFTWLPEMLSKLRGHHE